MSALGICYQLKSTKQCYQSKIWKVHLEGQIPLHRPGALIESRIIASNSGRPEPYTGTNTALVRSSRPRGRRPPHEAAPGDGTRPRRACFATNGTPGNPECPPTTMGRQELYSGAGRGPGLKLERVEFPACSRVLAPRPQVLAQRCCRKGTRLRQIS